MTLSALNIKLNALTIFRNLLDTEVVSSLVKLINSIEKGSLDEQVSAYGAFCKVVYENGGNLTDIITSLCLDDENLYLTGKMHNLEINENIKMAFDEEIKTLTQLAALTPEDISSNINFDGYLPKWDNIYGCCLIRQCQEAPGATPFRRRTQGTHPPVRRRTRKETGVKQHSGHASIYNGEQIYRAYISIYRDI